MDLKSLMDEFGNACGGLGIEAAEDGIWRIDVDGVIVAFRDQGEDMFVVWCEVGPLPSEGADALCRRLLEGACLGVDTDGAAFSVDAERGVVLIHRYCTLNGTTVKDFAMMLDGFLDVRERWAKELLPAAALPEEEPVPTSGFTRV